MPTTLHYLSTDHIYCNKPTLQTSKIISYQTLHNPSKYIINGKPLMSDHIPVAAIFRYNNKVESSKWEF